MSDEDRETFLVVIATPEALRDRFTQGYTHARSILDNGGCVELSVQVAHDPITALQRAFLHGAVLPQIAEQVYVGERRERYTTEAWKQFFFKEFVKPKYKMRRLPGAKRATPYRVNTSSEMLGVRAYAKWIDQIIDWAVLEHGVTFVFKPREREEVRYVSKPRSREQH